MNIFDFENRLRSHANSAKGEVDINRLLGDLNLIPTPKHTNRKLFFFLAAALLVSISSATYYYLSSTTSVPFVQTIQNPNNLSAPVVLNETPENTNSTITNAAKNMVVPSEDFPIAAANNKDAIQVSKLNNKSSAKNKIAPLSKRKIKENKSTAKQAKKHHATNTLAAIIPESIKNNSNNALASNNNEVSTTSINEVKAIAGNKSVPSVIPNLISNENISLLPMLSTSFLENAKPSLADKIKDCPRFGNRGWHLSIIPEVGYSLPMKTLSLDEKADREVFENRLANEKTIEGIHASVSFQFKNHVTGLYVKPGVAYTRITERMDLTRTEIQIDTMIGITNITTNPAGDTTTIINGEIYTETEIQSKSRTHYELHHFDLPIAIGYSFEVNRFTLDIEGGIKFNFLQKTSGRIPTADREFTNLDTKQQLFKNSFGLGFFGGILLKRQISSHTELYIAPRFTFNTLSVSSNINPINQKYNILGLHVGCVYAIY